MSKMGTFYQGIWVIDSNGDGDPTGETTFPFGLSGDIPVTADWNGDGVTKAGIYRNGNWSVDYNGDFEFTGPIVDRNFVFGLSGDQPVTAKRWR
jgi:hypothetical protein